MNDLNKNFQPHAPHESATTPAPEHELQHMGLRDGVRILAGTVMQGVQQAIVRPSVEIGRDGHRLAGVDAHLTQTGVLSERLAGQFEDPSESRALRIYRKLGSRAGKLNTPKHR